MKRFEVTIEGTADLLFNAFGVETMAGLDKGSKASTVAKDYSDEWKGKMYLLDDGTLYQPESHVLGTLVRAAVSEKIPGRRGKTYKDAVKASVFIVPSCIPHLVKAQDFEGAAVLTGPMANPDGCQPYVDRRAVRVQKAMVIRYRPALSRGWRLSFNLEVLDDDFRPDALKAILDRAGREVGIGDFRPRFGRFMVTKFEQAG